MTLFKVPVNVNVLESMFDRSYCINSGNIHQHLSECDILFCHHFTVKTRLDSFSQCPSSRANHNTRAMNISQREIEWPGSSIFKI